MGIQLAAATISAVVAMVSILLSAHTTRSNAKFQAQLQRELLISSFGLRMSCDKS
jgi:hypothetical protein